MDNKKNIAKGETVALSFFIKDTDTGQGDCFIVQATFTGKKTQREGIDYYRFENSSTARPYMLSKTKLNGMLCADLEDCDEITL